MKQKMNFFLELKYSGSKLEDWDIINRIIYNEPFSIVILFKDYLFMDDLTEFLQAYHIIEYSK